MSNYDEIKRSEFNEAGLKMISIHELQAVINKCSIDKLDWFVGEESLKIGMLKFTDYKRRNYEVIFECLNQLSMEMIAKLTDDDKQNIESKKKAIKQIVRRFKVHEEIQEVSGKIIGYILNRDAWFILEDKLDELQQDIRSLLDKHGYSGKEIKDPRVAVTN